MNGDEQLELIVTPEQAPPTPPPAPAEEFPFVTLPPEVTFTVRDVEPPAAAYVTPDDRLRIEARNSISGLTLEVHVRLLKPDGQIIQTLHTYTPTAARALNTWTAPLAEGFLLTCTVNAPQDAKPGCCYVRALLIRGSAPVVPIGQVLLAGYVVTGSALVWPYPRYVHPVEGPGRLRVIVGTDPAAGQEILEQVPAGARWRLLSVLADLLTAAGGADRYVKIWAADGANLLFQGAPVIGQPASSLYHYSGGLNWQGRSLAVYPAFVQIDLPDLWLTTGQRIGTATSGLQAGDDWGAPVIYVEEWIEP